MDPSGSASTPISEKLVARLWEDQRPFLLPLETTREEQIQVVYRGRRRWDRGPDFTGALIARAGASLIQGDVEIHVRSSDWRAHGHHRDLNYNNVVLQVVLWDDAAEPSRRQDGVPVPVVALASRLAVPLESLLATLQANGPRPSPCWPGAPEDGALADLLDRVGRERFALKAGRFESDLTCDSPDQLLYQGIAAALGYSQNRAPFRRLAELLPLAELLICRTVGRDDVATRRPEGAGESLPLPVGEGQGEGSALEALLLGGAGLLPSQRELPGTGEDPYARILEGTWAAQGPPWVGLPMKVAEWEFFRVRPANFPTRRVAALAALVERWPRDGLADLLADLVLSLEPKRVPRALEALLLGADPGGYWARHWDFGDPLRRPRHLIGRQRAAEVVVNVFLPFLAARASHSGDEGLGLRVAQIYRLYPKRGDNELARHVATQITTLPRPRVARSACRQQGLLHLYWSYCERRRCGECPISGARA